MTSIAFKPWLLALVVVLSLAGCGQKGPLFLPEEEEQEEEQESSVQPYLYIT